MRITPTPVTSFPLPTPQIEEPEAEQDCLFADEIDDADLSHTWVVAATIEVDPKIAKHSHLRGSFKTVADQKIDALEVYCSGCRRPWDEVADETCSAKEDNSHLIGGDPGVRKKRKIFEAPEDAERAIAPSIERRGIGAVVSGDA